MYSYDHMMQHRCLDTQRFASTLTAQIMQNEIFSEEFVFI